MKSELQGEREYREWSASEAVAGRGRQMSSPVAALTIAEMEFEGDADAVHD